jgi:hypothetical protein
MAKPRLRSCMEDNSILLLLEGLLFCQGRSYWGCMLDVVALVPVRTTVVETSEWWETGG